MSVPCPTEPQRLILASGLMASAVAAALVAWRHAASLEDVIYLCGSAQAHCWACYAAPGLAAVAIGVLAAPEMQIATPVRSRPKPRT